MSGYLIAGIDASINHCGIVALDEEGETAYTAYLTNVAKDVKVSLGGWRCPSRSSKKDSKDRHKLHFEVRRLVWLQEFFREQLVELTTLAGGARELYVTMEGYAYGSSQGAHQMGEVGGVVRLECARVGAGLRLHDPKTLKIFTSGNGNASKVEVVDDAVAKWGEWFDFMAYPTDVKEEGVRSDMADAYALARMGLMERWVRGGEVGLVELPEEERSIFTRITKTNPVGLAARTYALYPSARLAAIAAGTKR